jgi:TrmH family RNA methyltransferase
MVGTSGTSSAEKNHGRRPITPDELARWSRSVSGRIGIAFGREDFGLSYTELEMCDLLVTIPASPEYPILNISHAASIVLYELWKGRMPDHRRSGRTMDRTEKEALMDHYERLMKVSNVPPHKIPISMINFRRMIGKAAPNVREFYSLMGTFSRAMDYKRERSPFRVREHEPEE